MYFNVWLWNNAAKHRGLCVPGGLTVITRHQMGQEGYEATGPGLTTMDESEHQRQQRIDARLARAKKLFGAKEEEWCGECGLCDSCVAARSDEHYDRKRDGLMMRDE